MARSADTLQVDIIGAGLAGTALALALDQEEIPCRLWEARSANAAELASGVVLTPNGLRVLDHLGVFKRITDRSWKSDYRTYKNDKDETTKKVLITNEELYGYKNHRLWRRWLLEEMRLMLKERQVLITYESKYEGIIVDDKAEGVTFLINGKRKKTGRLIGADGIYSSLRKHLTEIIPEYTGVVGVISHIKRDSVSWPYPEFEKACTIQGKPGAFFMIPEVADASEIMVGMQVNFPDQSREVWEDMARDPDEMASFYRRGYDDWHPTAKSIIDAVCQNKDTLYLWPFLRMPKLPRWYSDSGRVIIVGDSAHALPPSSGQGVNQALEDVYTLSAILAKSESLDMLQSLESWQNRRQTRIDAVLDWATNTTNVQRMPEAERQKLIDAGKIPDPRSAGNLDDMRWLYQLSLD